MAFEKVVHFLAYLPWIKWIKLDPSNIKQNSYQISQYPDENYLVIKIVSLIQIDFVEFE